MPIYQLQASGCRFVPGRDFGGVSTALAVRAEETDTDGWLRLQVTFQDARHAEWALWQLATNAEALAPQWLRAALSSDARTCRVPR
ncbi:WYL domain-containing protein [Nocardia sp. NPDC020380]|uniref:WYL domain-containing protein n=1 Tax=Nocardia sp. NPDC020380 TaxID=3364309 RepID=UPI0037958656